MQKIVKTIPVIAILFIITSFTSSINIEGTFGVSPDDPSQIRLTLKNDYTYSYQDFSNPNKKIKINGNWHQTGKKIILENNGGSGKFHNVWIITQNGKVAKSRKGFSFYRLCKIENDK